MSGTCPGCGAGEGGYHLGATPKVVWYPAGPLCPVLAAKIIRAKEACGEQAGGEDAP